MDMFIDELFRDEDIGEETGEEPRREVVFDNKRIKDQF